MILTPLNIQIAIIKAFYALAKKSVKYYTGLAFGKNNTCLFKEIRLLRAYVEILRNFEIVGSTITCSCCVEGDYTVLLNSELPQTNTPIQFGCDNQGYMVYNNIGYPFIYWYDEPNQKIVINFTEDLDGVTITANTVEFTATCNITSNAVSPIEGAILETIEIPPVTVDNEYGDWSGSINIYEDNITIEPIISLTIPANIMDNPDAIVALWNAAYPEWILHYSNNTFSMASPLDTVDYSGYVFEFNQYEGGSDPGPSGPFSFSTSLLVLNGVDTQGKLLFLDNSGTIYEDLVFVNYLNVQQIIDVLNANCQPYSFELLESGTPPGVFPRIQITVPENSFEYFNPEIVEIRYTYEFDETYNNWIRFGGFFPLGVDPVLTPYRDIFEAGVLGDFINDNPCEPTTVTQTCLTNSQVSKIIAHINKLVR